MNTIESVIADMQKEYETLSATEWNECGDVNLEEYGGVKFRKGKHPGDIEVHYYRGLDDLPEGWDNEIRTSVSLSDLTEGVEEVWTFSDVAKCGLTLGWAILALQSYNGLLNN